MRLTRAQREFMRQLASNGGKKRAQLLSPERRRQISRQGALQRLRNVEAQAQAAGGAKDQQS